MITSKTALIAALSANNRAARLYGRMGARPGSYWKYEVIGADGKAVDTVSSVVADKLNLADLLVSVRGDWKHSIQRLRASAMLPGDAPTDAE